DERRQGRIDRQRNAMGADPKKNRR
ncbi:MAG: hypothetical protein RL459_289, partial [Pseudomonadota bacterium]